MIEWVSKLVKPGEKFGRYTVMQTYRNSSFKYFALCSCDCGTDPRFVRLDGLRSGSNQSCGCLQRESATTHGMWNSPIYTVWRGMMARCYKAADKRYKRYGGRGITVCERWHDVSCFVGDMFAGYQKGLQIDRIDNDKGYSPDNCRWADRGTQARNKSNIIQYSHDGKTMCLAEWSRHLNIHFQCLYDRLQRGWSVEKTLTTPSIPISESMPKALTTRWKKPQSF